MDTTDQINTGTRLFGVFGNPVSQSLSPVMHNRAFRETGFNGTYLAFRVKDIKEAAAAVRALNMGGASVTIPHKLSVMPYLDELTLLAKRIGAVNTIINRDGRLVGDNSDGMGAVLALEEKTAVRGKSVVIIGAGGSARAIGFTLREKGANVAIVNRSEERGKALAESLDASFCPLKDFSGAHTDILINATSLGMGPNKERMPVTTDIFKPGMVVMDIIYNPLKTCLLKTAKKKGCITVDGLAMFVYQGAFQFELWTGKKAPVDLMRKTVLKALDDV